jgi:hypothetical protein
MELHADKKVTLTLEGADEMGNPTDFDGTITFASSDEALVAVTDNGDGTASAAAVGPVGAAVVTAEATRASDGKTFSGAVAINVIAGDTESITVATGPEEEVTPDEA